MVFLLSKRFRADVQPVKAQVLFLEKEVEQPVSLSPAARTASHAGILCSMLWRRGEI